MRVGTVGALWRYPVKSMAGEALERCEIVPTYGIPGDRGWAVRDEAAGEIRGAKKIPALMRCGSRYLEEPEGASTPPVEIRLPGGRTVASSDPGAASALSEALGRAVTLWPRRPVDDPDHYRRARPIEDLEAEIRLSSALEPDEPLPRMPDLPPEMLDEVRRYVSPRGTYFDAFPLHVLTTASLETLARKVPGSLIDPRRFRPNVLVETLPSLAGLVEFDWCGRRLRIGSAVAHVVIPTLRCAMTTLAVEELPRDPAIMRALVRETGQNLGVVLSVVEPGRVRLGDPVEIL